MDTRSQLRVQKAVRISGPAGGLRSVTSMKHGVGSVSFPGVVPALTSIKARWLYSWVETRPSSLSLLPPDVEYIPMVARASHLERALTLPWVVKYLQGQNTIMAMNEIDRPDQANMSPEVAIEGYSKLVALYGRQDRTWVSPSVSANAERAGGPFERFMVLADQRGLPVDAVSIHCYPGWKQAATFSAPALAAAALRYIDGVYAKYQRPIWITEVAVVDFSTPGGATWAPLSIQKDFMALLLPQLQARSYVSRYAWYRLSTKTDPKYTAGLALPDTGVLTDLGQTYASLA